MFVFEHYRVIDISQPISSRTACYPGDAPFDRHVITTFKDSGIVNLTAFSMSPHVGTHVDAPIHCYGDLNEGRDTAGSMPLERFVGSAVVIDLSPCTGAIGSEQVCAGLERITATPARVLFKTKQKSDHEHFDEEYAFLSVEAARMLADRRIVLTGIDTPSVDRFHSKSLEVHHALIDAGIFWLENLDLTQATEGNYFLIALPLKLNELEASPVRAVLLKEEENEGR